MEEEEVEVEESKKEEREEEEVIRATMQSSVAMHQSCSCGPRGFFISSAQ